MNNYSKELLRRIGVFSAGLFIAALLIGLFMTCPASPASKNPELKEWRLYPFKVETLRSNREKCCHYEFFLAYSTERDLATLNELWFPQPEVIVSYGNTIEKDPLTGFPITQDFQWRIMMKSQTITPEHAQYVLKFARALPVKVFPFKTCVVAYMPNLNMIRVILHLQVHEDESMHLRYVDYLNKYFQENSLKKVF